VVLPTTTDSRHATRNSLLDVECTFTAGPDALFIHKGNSERHVPYGDITRVRLFSYAGGGGETFQATLHRRHGSPVKISSHHYRGLGNFEDRTRTYAPFIRELIRRVTIASPGTRFVAGSTGLWIMWLGVFALVALLAMILVGVLFGGGSSAGPIFVTAIVLATGAPFAWRQLQRGRANSFDPANPPPELLGQRQG
jgi:hypothetical protein